MERKQEYSENGIVKKILKIHQSITSIAIMMTLVSGTIIYNALWMQTPKAYVQQQNEQKQNEKTKISDVLITEIQNQLEKKGYYKGKIDGKFGDQTKLAIEKFQEQNEIEINGQASVKLLEQIIVAQAVHEPEKKLNLTDIIQQNTQQDNQIPKVKKTTIPVTPINESNNQNKISKEIIEQIQIGLKNYGYDEIIVDGKAGNKTRTAIQRFQLDFGMKITGEPDNKVLNKLKEIGAYKQG